MALRYSMTIPPTVSLVRPKPISCRTYIMYMCNPCELTTCVLYFCSLYNYLTSIHYLLFLTVDENCWSSCRTWTWCCTYINMQSCHSNAIQLWSFIQWKFLLHFVDCLFHCIVSPFRHGYLSLHCQFLKLRKRYCVYGCACPWRGGALWCVKASYHTAVSSLFKSVEDFTNNCPTLRYLWTRKIYWTLQEIMKFMIALVCEGQSSWCVSLSNHEYPQYTEKNTLVLRVGLFVVTFLSS